MRLLLVVLLPLAAAAVKGQTVRDSAGIQIVDNARPSSVIRVAAQPSVVIGTQAGDEYIFGRVAGAARLADGTIVVATGSQFRYFDRNGRFLRRFGQRGSGPGDFESLDLFRKLPGDTLLGGSSDGNRRHSYFTAAGAFVRDGPRAVNASGMPPGPKPIMAVLDNHSVVVAIPNLRPQANGRPKWIESGPVFAINRDGTHATQLGTFAFLELVATNGEPGPAWFAPTAAIAAATNLYIGFGGEYSINVVDPNGKIVRIIRRAWTPRRVTTADIEKYVREWAEFWIKPNSPTAAKERQELRESKFAETVPAFSEFRVDARGRLWVREPNLADAPLCGCLNEGVLGVSTWSVFDAAGRWVSDVRMPPRFHPRDIGADYILGVLRDEDGVATIAQYPITG